MKHMIEVERVSACGTWVERFFVELSAATAGDALAQVEFSLGESERIVAGVADAPDYFEAA
jgi:hypothetical protein